MGDVDGNEGIDYLLSAGPLISGHAHPAVVAAVQQQVARGSAFHHLTEPTIRLAERIGKAVPCAETLRFVGSGTEATFCALRVARAAAGQEKTLRFEGGWHGGHDLGPISATPA